MAEPVLVGREQELNELEHCLSSAASGNGGTVFVSGEAGAGKTRLVDEFLKRAPKNGAIVMRGSCLGTVTIPYFPFIEAFDAYFAPETEDIQISDLQQSDTQRSPLSSGHLSNEGNRIMTLLLAPNSLDNFGKQDWVSPQVWRDQTFAAVSRTLRAVADRQALILLLEDIHWADSASLGLLHYLAKVIGSDKILLIATFRSEELTVDEEGHPHPLVEALQFMRRENLVRELKLKGLEEQGVGKLAESMVNGSVDSKLVGKLAEESQGNPLFIVESLRMLQERRSLFLEKNQWHLVVDELGIPSKIKEIILRRLGMLKLSQRRVLDAASVIGDKFDVELLAAVLSQDRLEVLETLNFVAQSTSLVCCDQDFFRFDHAKSRETLYEEIPLPLRKGYHGRVAEKLEASAKEGKMPLTELAYHYAQAGNQEKALTYSMEAGKEALARFSNVEAISHFKYVLNSVGDAPERANQRLVALEGLGDAYFLNSMFKEAEKTLELLFSLSTGTTKMRALNKAIGTAFIRGDSRRTGELVRKAEEIPIVDRVEHAIITFHKGSALWGLGKPIEAVETCRKAIRTFEEEYSLWNLAVYLSLFGGYLIFIDKLEEGVASLLRSIAVSDDLKDNHLQANNYQTAGQLIYVNCGYPKEASIMLEKAVRIAEKIADYNKLAEANCVWSWTISARDPKAGIEKALKAKEYVEKTDSNRVQAMVYSTLTREYVLLGDMENAERYFNKLASLPKDVLFIPGPQALKTYAMYFAALGQWEKAEEFFIKQFELNKKLSPGGRARTKIHYAWALEKQGRSEEAKRSREEAQSEIERLDERFKRVSINATFIAPISIVVGQEFEARLDITNPSRSASSLIRIENLLTEGLEIRDFTPECNVHDGYIEIRENKLGPFGIRTVKLRLKATKPETFTIAPQVVFLDELGQTRTSTSPSITIRAKSAKPSFQVLPNRMPTGTLELDALLWGGIPENYAVVLASASTNERELLVRRFIEAGANNGETVFYITGELNSIKELAAQHPSNLYLLVCNLQADSLIQNAPNICKLKGVENLTEIDIAVTKILRSLPATTRPKRACLEIVSDALLQHHAIITRNWLCGLLATLKSKGFTSLAVLNPQMHMSEESQAIRSLFDGEIEINDSGSTKILKVKKLYNKDFSEDELTLRKEKSI